MPTPARTALFVAYRLTSKRSAIATKLRMTKGVVFNEVRSQFTND
ncbi:MAG: hypothetical protein V7L26_22050 [Nostoc sp.]